MPDTCDRAKQWSRRCKVPVKRILKHRVAVTLVLGAVSLVLTMIYAEHDVTGLPTDVFWENKISWQARADCVLAGDSRVFIGVSPAAMAPELQGRRIVNYGFSACGYDRAYLSAIARVLDPAGRRPTIILGITPHSLTRRATARSEFLRRINKPAGGPTYWETLEWQFRPFSLANAVVPLFPDCRAEHYYRHHVADGWAAASYVPEDPRLSLSRYRRTFTGQQVDPPMIEDVLRYAGAWTVRGIRVYAFRPPTTRKMVELEDALSGFRESEFVARFTAAGGVWLDTDQFGYTTYDGGHLRWDAAQQFSRDLARAVRAIENAAEPDAVFVRRASASVSTIGFDVPGNSPPRAARLTDPERIPDAGDGR
jgi:hypothetical protein